MSEESEPDSPELASGIVKALRIVQLQMELAELTGKPIAEHTAEDLPDDSPDAHLQHLENIESGPQFPLADLLKEHRNFTPAPLSRLSNPIDLSENLWLLLFTLASMRVFIYDTDHLSDEELYRTLVEKVLRSNTVDLPVSAGWNCRFSICEFSDEDTDLPECYLRYYADEEFRSEWIEDIPPKEDLPYDRDRFLPNIVPQLER
ncbi:hypothetical protein [Puniceicoccus vermicola]|uniref:Uncharacterized protein n=1 Tax=Puniceicoccus vermicola TaxID=388746 RepID=A0A7X1B0N5_9BACT|nr:hypothetical protein [Puniceicoccus vermicola]MBC2603407.1 hypothetical protein [Puniceicoccus vermicola]